MIKLTTEQAFREEHNDREQLDYTDFYNDLGDAGLYVTPGQVDDWIHNNGKDGTVEEFVRDKNREMLLDAYDEDKLRALYYANNSVEYAVKSVAAQVQEDEAWDDLKEKAEDSVVYMALTGGDSRADSIPETLYEIALGIVEDASDPLDLIPSEVRQEAKKQFERETGMSVDDYRRSDEIKETAGEKDLVDQDELYRKTSDSFDDFAWDDNKSLKDQFCDNYESDTSYMSDATVQDVINDHTDEILEVLKYDVSEPLDDIDLPIYEMNGRDVREALSTYCNQDPLIQYGLVYHLVGDVDNDYMLGRTAGKIRDFTEDEDLTMSQLMEKVEAAQDIDKELLNIEITGHTMRISAGKCDYIPSDFVYVPGGSNVQKIVVDDSIKSIGPAAFRSRNGIEIDLPDSIEICENFASCEYVRTLKVGDKTYDLTGIDPNNYVGQVAKVGQILDEHGIPSTPTNVNNALGYFETGNADSPAYNLQTITNPRTRGELVQEPYDQMATEALIKACNNYKGNEVEPSALMSIQELSKAAQQAVERDKASVEHDLSEEFKKNYRGHVPKVINLITEARYYSEIPKDYASNKRFNPNEMQFAIQNNVPAAHAILLMGIYKNPQLHNILQSPHEHAIYTALQDDIEHTGKVTNKTKAFVDFAVKMSDTQKAVINTISDYREYLDFSNPTREGLMTQVAKHLAQLEAEKVENEYCKPDCNFKLSECKCNLKNADVTFGKYRAYILDAQDPRQTSIGYDTSCCQHLGGAGESAMMYGLMNPNAGFFVIEHKDTGKVVAQGETWESSKNTLVFDNLEFADDRDVRLFLPVLAKWANEVDYKNVYSGIGYNQIDEMDNGRLTHHHGIVPPRIPEVPDPYTDADEKTFVIKKDGKVDPYFSKAYERTTGKLLPLIPERKVKEQSKDIATPYIKKATREQFKDAPTFQQVMERHTSNDIDR